MSFQRPHGPRTFDRLALYGFRQYAFLDLDLRGDITVLTGANGTGKTTILNILSTHFDWPADLIAAPGEKEIDQSDFPLDLRETNRRYVVTQTELSEDQRAFLDTHVDVALNDPPSIEIGRLRYSDGATSSLRIAQRSSSIQYSILNPFRRSVDGLYLTSHRTLNSYKPITTIPSRFVGPELILKEYISELRSLQVNRRTEKSPMFRLKEALLAAAIYGEGNTSVRPNAEAKGIWSGFQEVLRILAPKHIGFNRLFAIPPEIMLDTETGTYPIDAISGGMHALLDLAWQIFLLTYGADRFTVCIDEPENHLHPAMQRTLMPNLLKAFPNVKFIVATHSPFVVTASRDARVYVLDYGNDGLVYSSVLDFVNKAQSAEQTLTDVLGLSSTAPVWAEEEFNTLMSEFVNRPVSKATIRELRTRLSEKGLANELPTALKIYLEGEDTT
ncbi:AAA family ATPase [Mycolicibacterium sp. J2]|uniref:AAA family ATPase n=1 Tax=Mycolicibacterium sp. J2 TaxID=2993511 RepID=UPI00224B7574|nr:AAA family ATPase [Mycolicibacterium sp. J2]MCX2710797.1 AAA family ATPase [Mycolicibacterium sp. J2]